MLVPAIELPTKLEESRRAVYIQDRREAEQAIAYDTVGQRLRAWSTWPMAVASCAVRQPTILRAMRRV